MTRVSFVWRNMYFNAFSPKCVFKYEMSFQSIPTTPYITFRFWAKASKLLVFTTVRSCVVFSFVLFAISTRRNVLYPPTARTTYVSDNNRFPVGVLLRNIYRSRQWFFSQTRGKPSDGDRWKDENIYGPFNMNNINFRFSDVISKVIAENTLSAFINIRRHNDFKPLLSFT